MDPFAMSVNNAGEGHSAHWWADENPTLQAIYFDGDEHPRIAPVATPFVLYIVRPDGASAVGGIGRVTGARDGTPRANGAQRSRAFWRWSVRRTNSRLCCPSVGSTARPVVLHAG